MRTPPRNLEKKVCVRNWTLGGKIKLNQGPRKFGHRDWGFREHFTGREMETNVREKELPDRQIGRGGGGLEKGLPIGKQGQHARRFRPACLTRRREAKT